MDALSSQRCIRYYSFRALRLCDVITQHSFFAAYSKICCPMFGLSFFYPYTYFSLNYRKPGYHERVTSQLLQESSQKDS